MIGLMYVYVLLSVLILLLSGNHSDQSVVSSLQGNVYAYPFFLTASSSAIKIVEETKSPSEILIDYSYKSNIDFLPELLSEIDNLEMQEEVYGIVTRYYPAYITDVVFKDEDVVFTIGGQEIWYDKGRMLFDNSKQSTQEYRSTLYTYNTDLLINFFKDLPKPHRDFSKQYVRSSDFQIALVGGMPQEIEHLIREYRILGIGVRLHPIAAEYALKASKEVLELAKTDKEIKEFVNGLKTISGYVIRNVSNSTNISMHAFGLAFDFIPYDYEGKVTYWQWAQVLYPDDWNTIQLEKRWLAPVDVVKIFEKHGFIWGGKWPHYDTMHFEFRPELIGYAEAREITGSPTNWDRRTESVDRKTVPNDMILENGR